MLEWISGLTMSTMSLVMLRHSYPDAVLATCAVFTYMALMTSPIRPENTVVLSTAWIVFGGLFFVLVTVVMSKHSGLRDLHPIVRYAIAQLAVLGLGGFSHLKAIIFSNDDPVSRKKIYYEVYLSCLIGGVLAMVLLSTLLRLGLI